MTQNKIQTKITHTVAVYDNENMGFQKVFDTIEEASLAISKALYESWKFDGETIPHHTWQINYRKDVIFVKDDEK